MPPVFVSPEAFLFMSKLILIMDGLSSYLSKLILIRRLGTTPVL